MSLSILFFKLQHNRYHLCYLFGKLLIFSTITMKIINKDVK